MTPELRTKYVFTITSLIGPVINAGETGHGVRRVIPVIGGEIRGESINGRLLPSGADFQIIRANELIDKASPYLLDLSRELGETTNIQEMDGHEIVFVARFPGRHLVNIDIVVGARLPALFTASGTAMLSRLPAQQVQQVLAQSRLEPMTHFTQINPEKLMERIRVAARRGYAAVENETVLGDISIAAPITDHNGLAVAAINISVPTTRWTMERVEAELAKHVQVVATSISKSRFSSLRY